MAERRMFARSIIDSARFLKMPVSSQALYFHLGLRADDDGVVEAWSVLQTTGTGEDDLRVLVSKGFVVVLNEDLVSYISDWTTHNNIRPDRKADSQYRDLLLQVVPDAALVTPRQRSDIAKVLPSGPSMDRPRTDNGPLRLGKDRLGKGSIGEDSTGGTASPTPVKKKFGQYGWVQLTGEEHSRLLSDLGEPEVTRCVAYIDESAQSTGNKNKWRDWNLVLRKCSREGWGIAKATQGTIRRSAREPGRISKLAEGENPFAEWANLE